MERGIPSVHIGACGGSIALGVGQDAVDGSYICTRGLGSVIDAHSHAKGLGRSGKAGGGSVVDHCLGSRDGTVHAVSGSLRRPLLSRTNEADIAIEFFEDETQL